MMIKFAAELFHRFKKNEFYRNVFTLFSGSVIAQGIAFLITPLLTRLYPDFQFGIFFLFTSMSLTIAGSACLQYETAIVIPKDDRDALNLTVLCFIIAFIFSILTAMALFFFSDGICRILKNDNIRHYFFIVPVSVFALGVNQAVSAWNNRKKQYRFISVINVTKSVSSGTVQSLAGISGFLNSGLIVGNLFGQIISLMLQIRKWFMEARDSLKAISFKRMFYLAKVYKNMPIFNTFSNIMNNLSNQLPVFLLTRFFGVSSASYYGISNRIIATPMGLIGQSVSLVFIQNAAEASYNKQNLFKLLKGMYWRLFKIAFIPFTLLFFASPFLFKLILGNSWDCHLASNIARILIPWLLVGFLNSSLGLIINILKKQSAYTIYNFLLLVFRFLSIWLGYLFSKNLLFALFLFSITGLIFNLFLVFYLLKVSKNDSET